MPCYLRTLKKGDFWFYKFDHEGQTYFSKAEFKTKNEAKKAERKRFSEIEQSRYRDNKSIKLSKLIDERMKYLRSRKSKKYCVENQHYFKLLREYTGDILVKDVSRQMINRVLLEYSDRLKSEKKGNYAVNSMLRCLKALFNYGINFCDCFSVNPCIGIQPFSVSRNIKYVPTDDEIDNVLSYCDSQEEMIIMFVCQTGARIGECIRLTYADIHQDYVVLYTHKSKNSDLTPRKVNRPDCFRNLVFPKDTSKRVFDRWSETPRFLENIVGSLNMNKWSWHNLRHRFASLLSKQGKPVYEIMNLLGHSSLKTTQIYLQMLP